MNRLHAGADAPFPENVKVRGGALIGYARVSSRGQSLDVQETALRRVGVDERHLFREKLSGTKREGRTALDDAIRFARKGDALVCCRLDRLARSARDLLDIAKMLEDAGVDLVVLEQPINTTTPEGRLFFTMVGAFGEFENQIRKQRQREGIDAVLAKGVDSPFKGRPPTIRPETIERLAQQGMYPAAIARELGVSRQSIYRIAAASGIELTSSRPAAGAAMRMAYPRTPAPRSRRSTGHQ